MRTLGVAVWGIGQHARRNVIPAINACPGLRLYGLCSRDRSSVAGLAAQFNCKYWGTPDEMLVDPKVDVVYLSTPIGLHFLHGRAVLERGKHLWCEKPLADSLEKVSELVELSRRQGVSVNECFMYLYHPQFRELAALLRAGAVGDIQSIDCRFGIPPLERPGFRLSPDLGGGAFLDVGCYPVSAAAALYPEGEPEVLLSEILTKAGDSVDSSGRAVLGYEDGARVYAEWGINRAYRNEIGVWGRVGCAWTDRIFSKPPDYVPTIRLTNLTGVATNRLVPKGNHFVSMLEAFCDTAITSDTAEVERRRVLLRARLNHKIKTASNLRSGKWNTN